MKRIVCGIALALAILYQFALKDRYVPLPKAQAFFDASPGPKTLGFYADNHGLRSRQAVADRVDWLIERLTHAPE